MGGTKAWTMHFQLGNSTFGGEERDRGTKDIRKGLVSRGDAIGDKMMNKSHIAEHLIRLSEPIACCVEPHYLPMTLLLLYSHIVSYPRNSPFSFKHY